MCALGGLVALAILGAILDGASRTTSTVPQAGTMPRLNVRISNPVDFEVRRPRVVIRGRAPANADVRVNQTQPGHRSRRTFSSTVELRRGRNEILVTASAPGHEPFRAIVNVTRN